MSIEQGVENTWKNTSLKNLCECEFCKSGKVTTHNDASHSQALFLSWPFSPQSDPALPELQIVGGTTKCARVMSKFLESNDNFGRNKFEGKLLVEVGSGTGLVGLSVAMLGCDVVLTDQSVVLELLQENVEANFSKPNFDPKLSGKVILEEVFWGSELSPKMQSRNIDYVLGSDLIFAKENIPLLLKTFKSFCPPDKNVEILFAHIDRFSWEETFFTGMNENGFHSDIIYTEDEIKIYSFRRMTSGVSGI